MNEANREPRGVVGRESPPAAPALGLGLLILRLLFGRTSLAGSSASESSSSASASMSAEAETPTAAAPRLPPAAPPTAQTTELLVQETIVMAPELSHFRNKGRVLFEALLVCLACGLRARASWECGLSSLVFPRGRRSGLLLHGGFLSDGCLCVGFRSRTWGSGRRASGRLLGSFVVFARPGGRWWSRGFETSSVHVSEIDDRQA